jgi:putative transcriptional regulator
MPVDVHIDVMLARRKISAGELADRVASTPANLAVLWNGRAKPVRLATLPPLARCSDANRTTCCAGSPISDALTQPALPAGTPRGKAST